MTKILFVIPTLGGGGAERVLINLVNGMDKTKYDITVQTIFDVGVNRNYLSSDVKYIGGIKRQFPGNSKVMKLLSPEKLFKLFIKDKYDIIVSYLEGPSARLVSGCNDNNTKLVAWIHVEQGNIDYASASFRSIKEAKKCYSRYDYISFVSKNVMEDFKSIFDIDCPNSVVFNTINSDEILLKADEKTEIEFSDEINVISVGRLMEQKGYDRLIQAHKRLLDEGIKHNVYLLGEGPLEASLKKQTEICGVDNSFHFLGYIDNPYKYVKQADLFICSSRREGMSTAVTESLIVGTPVVSTDCSGAKELLGEFNEFGIVVENSTDGIYSGLKLMMTDEGLYKQYSENSFERGKSFYSQSTIESAQKVFDDLLR